MAYHHYKHDQIDPKADRVAVYERHVADLFLRNKLTDSERDSSLLFEQKHSHGAVQFARVLAKKRNLCEDVCAVAMLLHDIHVGLTGSYKDHAQKSADLAKQMLGEIGLFSKEEQALIIKIIANHSDKHINSNDPYIELGKDADLLDCFLYPNAVDGYRAQKTPEIFKIYMERGAKVFSELGIPFVEGK
ncbi:MAG: HD domain-containing protein [Firmicutes bacterium]|nr:HD domain-containing protein [Bacillota bacterium]